MNKRWQKLFLPAAVLGVLIAGWYSYHTFFRPSAQIAVDKGASASEVVKTVRARIASEEFVLEVADTPESRRRGLMERTELCANCGMLFVFDKPGEYPFWMKNTPLSLDIVWLHRRKIAALAENTEPLSRKLINPGVIADEVIELPAGTAKRLNLQIGQTVIIDNF